MKQQRAFILIFDMLAGHWADGVTVPATELPPPNVEGYLRAGKLPNFRECVENGVFVRSWNRDVCRTAYAQKYLASGTYKNIKVEPGSEPYARMTEGADIKTILTACKEKYPGGKVGSFGSDAWMQTGWWKAPDVTCGWGSYFSDFLTAQHCFNWMMGAPDWKMSLLYLSQYDMTAGCPVCKENAAYTEDKHHSLLYLDRILWAVVEFLKENGWWEETFLFIGSDHGAHYGCEVSVGEGREKGAPEGELANYCGNHQPPYDCRLWDFVKDSVSDIRSDCCRRNAFIISGGALPDSRRNIIVPEGDIIDFAPTIADLMEIDFKAEGKSVF